MRLDQGAVVVTGTCCERCGCENPSYLTGSWFNAEMICEQCDAAAFDAARAAEEAAVRRGEFNYPGIGLPPDLRPGGRGC